MTTYHPTDVVEPDDQLLLNEPAQDENVPSAQLDVEALRQWQLGRWAHERLAARELSAREELIKIEGLPMADHRQRVLEQLGILVDAKAVHRAFPVGLGGEENPGGNIAGFEELVIADPSLQIKAGVQWGLFGAAVLHLGTDSHHERFLPGIMDLSVPGAFAMTEIGHGSDVSAIGTTATYDPQTEEFVLHTPFRAATKEFLGNAALHGKDAVVFAQLITNGVNHGVHCFYAHLRDDNGEMLPGVSSEDDGLKGGLNGIDNGRLTFDQVRIPRDYLLNRYADVAPDGTYSSPIASPGRRFFTMLGTLVQGRVSLDGSSVVAAKIGLAAALRYAEQRRQFTSTSDIEEQLLLDYQLHQKRLLPRLAKTLAIGFAHEELLTKFHEVFSGQNDSDENRQDLETMAAALKPQSTWHALDTLQEAREACGGAGFMAENRFASLRADLDIYVTFEGDNNVLLQLVAKRLLGDFADEFKSFNFGTISKFVAGHAREAVYYRSGLSRWMQAVADTGSERKSANWFKSDDVQHGLLSSRVETMVNAVGSKLMTVAKADPATQAKTFNQHQVEIIDMARAHAELITWEAFTRALERLPETAGEETVQVLRWVRDLYALTTIEENLDWYLLNGRISVNRARTLSGYINRLLHRIRPFTKELVDSFGLEDKHIRATVATNAEGTRQAEAAEYYRQLRASADAPVPEKSLKKKKN